MKQSNSGRDRTRRGPPSLRATRRLLGDGLSATWATRFALWRSALAGARFAARQGRAPLRTMAVAGVRASGHGAGAGRDDGPGGESLDRSTPGNAADAPAATADATFDAFLETCAPFGHPPHE